MSLSTKPPSTQPATFSPTTFHGVIWAGVAVSLVFLLIRLFARCKTFKKLFCDDFFVIFAWLLALLTAVYCQVIEGWASKLTAVTSDQHRPQPSSFLEDLEYSVKVLKGSVVILVFFYTSLWAVKVSFLLFFRRLGHNVMGQKVIWWCVFALTLASYFVCIGDIQYSCLTAPPENIIDHCAMGTALRFQQITLKSNCAIDVLTDFAIMAIPISMLWSVQMSLRKKAALVGIFSLAIITCVVAIVRVIVISTVTAQPHALWSSRWNQAVWISVEQSVAIIVASLASFRTLFTQQASRPNEPKRSIIDDTRNIFLRGTRRLHPSNDTSDGLTGLSSMGSTDQIVPPDRMYLRNGEAMKWEEDVESWGGQSVFQQHPLDEGTLAESKATRRGLREGL